MRAFSKYLILFVLGLVFSVSSPAAEPSARAEALVRKAAEAFKKDPKAAIQDINSQSANLKDGEIYLFAYDLEGYCVAIGFNTFNIVGKNRLSQKDPDGVYNVKNFLEIAKGKGEGWTDYKYMNPESGNIQKKHTFVMKVDVTEAQAKSLGIRGTTLAIGAGVYVP